MQKGQIMLRLFVPAYQDAPKAVHPRMRPLHDPAPRALARLIFDRLCFLTTRPNMCGESKLRHDIAHFLIVVPFIETQALRLRRRWLRALDDEAVERGPHQFHIVPVSTSPHQSNRDTMALSQQTALDPAFGAIGGIGTSSPPRVAPWSARRPCSASASQCLAARHTGLPPLARGAGTRPPQPTPETGRGRWIWHIIRSAAALPIGSLSAGRKKWHRRSDDQTPGAAH